MNEIAASSKVTSATDWKKVSIYLIRNSGGQVPRDLLFMVAGTSS